MTTIKTKIAANGTALYYVDGKRVSRDVAIEAATVNRNGNPFNVIFYAYNTSVGNFTEQTVSVNKLAINLRRESHTRDIVFNVEVNGTRIKSFCGFKTDADKVKQAKKDASLFVDKIVAAYIADAYGVNIVDDFSLISAPEADVEDYAVTVEAQDAAIDAEIENANNSTDEIVNVENLTANQRLAAQIVAKLGNLIVKCNTGEFGTRSGKTIHYETYADENDEFGTTLSIVEVFTDEENFILDHVNLIKGYGDDKTVETFYFTKPEVESVNVEDYAVTIEAQDVATEAEIELATVNTESSSKESAPADDFEVKLAELQANVDAAKADYDVAIANLDAKKAELRELKVVVGAAEDAKKVARNNLDNERKALSRFMDYKVKELTNTLILADKFLMHDYTIRLYDQDGDRITGGCDQLYFHTMFLKFDINMPRHVATYDTPAINQLKAAIIRGDKEFKFPTIDELDTQNAMDVFKKIYRFGRLRHVVASNGQHMWHSYGRRISAMERDSILKEYGITVDAFLAAEKQFQIEDDARLDAALKAHDQARFLWDKIQRESKPLDDDNVADLLPSVDVLNDVQIDEPPEPYKPQCVWINPHNYGDPGNLNFDPNDRLRAYLDTVDGLNNPPTKPTPEYKPQCTWENPHTIVMKTALLRCQIACQVLDIPAALNELKLFATYRDANKVELEEEPAPTPKRARQIDNNKTIASNLKKAAKRRVSFINRLNDAIKSVEEDCAFNQVCYDEPDDSRERVHFDAELKQLIAKGLRLIQKRDKLATHRDRLYLTIEKLDAQAI